MRTTQAIFNSAAVFLLSASALSVSAANWSVTEAQMQHGDLKQAFVNEDRSTTILTLQHASGWAYGDNFFFFDHLNYSNEAGGDGDELYGEWYSNFSLGKISGKDLSFAFVRDLGVIAGFNFAPEVDTIYYLPGIRLALDLPGFAFANLDMTAYIQDSDMLPKEDDSFMVDFNWAYPFSIGSAAFSVEGHVEYIDGAENDAGGERESWILAQPQVRYDIGKSLFSQPDSLFIGIEYQYWQNKLGDKNTDENTVQALGVWRF
ncbi:hypothetical protein BTA51_09260 [Hahella sp. CCB-MM4]|uniref:outer membrane protein OmpK n=1 Tax=Hahella sp. (strain CCB-MM4) TaxID=1926491 RepID=UPI000BCC3DEF|nr:outer membrane protein OmpK [Hahella sp. CCB-MM4]OZG73957.1 hypothetical protein BTA51_09260 [Hahella sp. CCB-MM4]